MVYERALKIAYVPGTKFKQEIAGPIVTQRDLLFPPRKLIQKPRWKYSGHSQFLSRAI